MTAELSRDAFLGGRVHLFQPIGGYRAGIDPVLLAASVAATSGDSVLELGCGAAPGLCCLGVRVPGLTLTGVEIQPFYANLARRNLAENGLTAEVVEADLSSLPASLLARQFDHVFANPPYFKSGKRSQAEDDGREIALAAKTPLSAWVNVAARRLAPRGQVTFIQRMERLPELLTAMQERLGSVQVLPLAPRVGRDPRLVLVRARKGGRADFRLHAPVILHEGHTHGQDGEDYAAPISDVLRRGAPLNFPA
ncbi:tRNA1(Val) (adenine(37)-N6)-methyltransferase [Primorskyibacter flagellatus]|uniref:tRNA1(Val) (adenine(37)-N6)-methyltransferase n=1 Tax=Primorskyibacter flagellatus TaxID=1387277 RepID=UPI003A9451C3